MSTFSKNPFELLAAADENADPSTISPKKDTKKKSEAKEQPKKLDNSRARPQDARLKRDYPQRGGFKAVPIDRIARSRDTGSFENAPESNRSERGGFRGRGRGGRGRGRGGRGREFDRRSGTGREDGHKKEVAGKGSWGEATENPEESTEAAPAAEGENAENKEETPVEEKEEEKVKTLEEYQAELAAKKAALNKSTQVRKANEGADESQWKGAVPLQKQDVDEADDLAPFIFGVGSKGEKSKSKKEKAQKVHLDIEQKFADEDRPRRGRGGFRGAGRGGREGRGRGGKPQAVNINDDKAFPSLGK
ncbi:hypothetical protein BKA69DRAFT_1121519 [Paraphysoderma sedebokerense]|nr:hypothetical protein BKA69DRAFT_1121519 [Paraphysoderma sedebokerense]